MNQTISHVISTTVGHFVSPLEHNSSLLYEQCVTRYIEWYKQMTEAYSQLSTYWDESLAQSYIKSVLICFTLMPVIHMLKTLVFYEPNRQPYNKHHGWPSQLSLIDVRKFRENLDFFIKIYEITQKKSFTILFHIISIEQSLPIVHLYATYCFTTSRHINLY